MRSLILFLINPLIGFFSAIKSLDRRFNGLVFVLFYALFGYAISFNLTTADSYRIAARFCQNDFDFRLIWALYREGTITDVFLFFIYGIVQPFTRNPKVLYGILGAIMGIFSYLSIKQLYVIWREERDRFFYMLVFFFFLTVSFFNVNGIRFWTATAWISYYIIRYLYFNKKTALVGVILTPLFHYGYIIGVVGFLIFVLLHSLINNSSFYYIFLIISIAISVVVPNNKAGDIMGSFGDNEVLTSSAAINTKSKYYIHSEENDQSKEAATQYEGGSLYRQVNYLFTRTFEYVSKIGMVILLTVLYRRRRTIIQNRVRSRLFNYVLYAHAIGFLAGFMIVSGGRFLRLANMMFVFWLLAVFRQNVVVNPKWRGYVLAQFLINFYAIAFLFFNAPRLVEPLFWFVPPIMTIVRGIGFSPIDFI